MDVTEYDRLYLPVQTRPLIHPYSDADRCATDIRVVKLEEALADKLKCLLQRRYCYDLFDLVYGAFMSRDIEVNRVELMQVFLRKTVLGHSPGAARNLLLDLPVDLFRGYWGKVIVPAVTRFSSTMPLRCSSPACSRSSTSQDTALVPCTPSTRPTSATPSLRPAAA